MKHIKTATQLAQYIKEALEEIGYIRYADLDEDINHLDIKLDNGTEYVIKIMRVG